jgi:hypothetical protein
MQRSLRLLFGPLAAAIFCIGVPVLALMVPGYSHVHQTVSEIGAMDTPGRVPFAIMLGSISVCMFVFASGVWGVWCATGLSKVAAILIACMGISCLGVGIFATPHPLHNVFGMSEIVGYQTPFFLALAWRKDPKTRALVIWSWVMFALLWTAMALNMSPLYPPLWAQLRPINGLVQRSLFLAWFGWCAIAGVLMWRRERDKLA